MAITAIMTITFIMAIAAITAITDMRAITASTGIRAVTVNETTTVSKEMYVIKAILCPLKLSRKQLEPLQPSQPFRPFGLLQLFWPSQLSLQLGSLVVMLLEEPPEKNAAIKVIEVI